MSQNKLNVSISPHLKKDISVKKVMWLVIAALLPAYIHTIYLYGISTVWVSLTAVIAAVISEAGMQKLFKKEVTISDGSAILTALLLTFNVPPSIALWKVALATVFAIVVAKQLFGGLGYNIFNPALVGRAFLVASYPVAITSGWIQPKGGFLSISQKSAAAIEATGAEATKLVDTVTS
ncbi:MAG TPA: RnfABCDGE type electron transport complex subunit D, partial [Candidatus Mcinerneyibacterium sp.]|nr:RnfABCDGE type electron transport complex subunit D [Candidatus Mcinerneyibacterium sp.]